MKRINTPKAPTAVGPYSQGVIIGNTLYTAGQIALTPDGALLDGSVEDQAHQVMKNLGAILDAANCRFANVVHTKIYIAKKEHFPRVNKVYAQYFPEGEEPARECVVALPPLEGAQVEMSMIAEVPETT